MKRVAGDWPLVAAATESADRCAALMSHHASDLPVEILRAEPTEEGDSIMPLTAAR
jgi:hypothetical protein